MAKSIDCCITDGCFCVAAKGLHICLGCWDNIFIDLMSGDSDSGPSMDDCYGSGRSCEMGMCLNTPQEGETICASCWNKHDGADTPGFPSESDDLEDCTQSCKEMGMMSEGCEFCK